jgi:outer membrane protein assembly factor BamB
VLTAQPADDTRVAVKAPVPKADPVTADWPVGRGNPQSTGVGAAKLPDQLTERWVFKAKDSVEGAPVVVDGVAYLASADKHLYAVELASGKEKWKVKLGPMRAGAAVQGGRVYVGDLEGKVYAVEAATGKRVWTYESDVGGEIASGCNFHGDNILVAAQGMPLTCLDKDGKAVWKFEIDGGSNGSPTVSGDMVFASGCDSAFHAIDAKTGKELWSVPITGQAAATSATAGDFATVGTVTNQVIGFDLKAKAKLWEFEPAVKSQPFYSSAAVTDKLVVTASRDKKVYALDRNTGKPAWTFVTEGMVNASPVVIGGRVYVGCESLPGEFYVLELGTGKLVQQITLDGAVVGSVGVGPDCILVGTEKGSVYCFGK